MPFHPLFDIDQAERARLLALPRDQAIAVAAAARDGVLTHAQLLVLGVSKPAISRRLERKLLFPRHRGVYAVGRLDLSWRGRLRAALLRCGRCAALSHHTAATQADVLDPQGRIAITTTVTGRRPDRRSGIDLHFTAAWQPGEVVWLHGLPCTSVARTISDLAGGTDQRAFRRAWNSADRQLLLDVPSLSAQVARRRAGCHRVRARLERYTEAPPTESELEELYLDLCDATGSRRPVAQWPLGVGDRAGRVDFVYLPERVAVELDGRTWHATQSAFAADQAKDLALREAGFEPHRYGYRQLQDHGPRVMAAVRSAVEARSTRHRAR